MRRTATELGYRCDWHEPVIPNGGHLVAHRRTEEEPCPQSRRERSAASWVREHGSLAGWKYKPHPPGGFYYSDCDTIAPVVPTARHYKRHRREGSMYCLRSLLERSAKSWENSKGSLDGWEASLFDSNTHRVYQVNIGGDRYYGRTVRNLELRLLQHRRKQSLSIVGERMNAGELYKAETLCEFPGDRFSAIMLEMMCIRSGNPDGKILNEEHNPWFGLPAPHWGPV